MPYRLTPPGGLASLRACRRDDDDPPHPPGPHRSKPIIPVVCPSGEDVLLGAAHPCLRGADVRPCGTETRSVRWIERPVREANDCQDARANLPGRRG